MAKHHDTPSPSTATTITTERAARLYRLLALLSSGPQKRDTLARRLGLGLRAFYRDLEALRKAGIELSLEEGHYALTEKVTQATAKLPFPDPGLTLGEARQLARGRSTAHRKLATQIKAVEAAAPAKKKARK